MINKGNRDATMGVDEDLQDEEVEATIKLEKMLEAVGKDFRKNIKGYMKSRKFRDRY